jgi:hypothetical protein
MRKFSALLIVLLATYTTVLSQSIVPKDCCDSLKTVEPPIKKPVVRKLPNGNNTNETIILKNEVHLNSDSTACCGFTPAQKEGSFPYALFFPDVLWILGWALLVLVFSKQIFSLLELLITRIKHGGSVKFGSFELGSRTVARGSGKSGSLISSRKDDGQLDEIRSGVYDRLRNAMLVHTILKSNIENQAYDLVIYIIPRVDHSLLGLAAVEYYFGSYWDSQIYRSIDRANGFAIVTSAYGPFLCLARLIFSDGTDAYVTRYIDFEMGDSAPSAPPPAKTKKTNNNTGENGEQAEGPSENIAMP